jgi:hypothetical protein
VVPVYGKPDLIRVSLISRENLLPNRQQIVSSVLLQDGGDLIGGFLIRHVEITDLFPAIEHARKVNVVIRDPQDVFDSYSSKLC